ncbi:DUF4367 domain-containing protein [Mediterraneibacter glycyrrhizinilyticus]|uniref:DUF4367 domain-containing protein n=1 Tax=Mediterraneibacter glycyrrhizinilyticus TaxID=342942 RepID=UPI00265AA4C0|nr:DUF4367 domain-containing protein [Mediterraneibacter glycyrrhizinilyticus]
MERILKSSVEIPDSVEQKINDTYRDLGLADKSGSRTVRKRKRKAWVTIAAAAALVAGLGVTVYAAGQFFSAQLTQEGDKLTYSLAIDPAEKEAHEIQVTPGYVPEGYVYQEEGPYESKWYNEETGGSMSVIPYNAAELYEISQTQDDPLHAPFNEDSFVKAVDIQGMSVDIFSSEGDYIDSDETIQNIFVFNEEWGYAVHVYLDGPDLADDEAVRVAEGLDIEVLDTTVPYPTEEEIAAINEENQRIENEIKNAASGITDDSIRGLNDVMKIDGSIYDHGIEYQAVDIQVTDTLPPDEFPEENFIVDYDSTLAEYVNEDGSLKPHERFTNAASRKTESAEASFIIVTTKIRNTGDTAQDVYLSPFLRHLDENGNGTYRLSQPRDKSSPAQESWKRLTTDGFPFYQSAPNNGETEELFTTIHPGEEIECTSVYVADNDCLDSAYMQYFNIGAAAADTPELYVKVTE